MADPTPVRRVRSFVRREGRMTQAQQRALDLLWERYGLDPEPGQILDLRDVFDREAPVTLEVGFGNGESLALQAAAHPERNFLGVEVHRPGVGHLLQLAARQDLRNLRVVVADAAEIIRTHLSPESVDRVQVFFPDPWPKKRHHKRRLVQPGFLFDLARIVRAGGELHLATDWEDYSRHMHEVLEDARPFWIADGPQPLPSRPDGRPMTRFEHRGDRLGHEIHDFRYLRTPIRPAGG